MKKYSFNKRYHSFIVCLLSCNILFSGCSKKLDIDPLGSTLTEESIQALVKKNPDQVLQPMLTSMVSAINGYTYVNSVDSKNLSVINMLLDLKGNDMILANRNGSWLVDDYELRAYREQNTSRVAIYWNTFYKYIFYANQILSLIPPDVDLSVANGTNEKIMMYKAAALTMRAFSYTYLMWLYQDDYLSGGKDKLGVPLHLDNNNPLMDRASSQEVWSQIVTDASDAIQLFKTSGYYMTNDRTDIDGTVASVVLARAALTMGDWTTAIKAASEVIEKYPTLMNEQQYTSSGMTILDNEAIFGYKVDATTSKGQGSFPGWMNPYGEGGYGGSQGAWMAIDQRLYDKIPATDYRKKNFVQGDYIVITYPSSGSSLNYPKYNSLKFAAGIVTGQTTAYYQNEIYMRSSEMLLLKAEAEVRSGDDEAAKQTLYQLASKRDAGYTLSSKKGNDLLTEIQLQRRIELWGEGGFEFYDNKRWNISVDRNSSPNHLYKSTILVPQKDFTFQIPLESELLLNPAIKTQNP